MAKNQKRVVTVGVTTFEQVQERISKAIRTSQFPGYGISFFSFELMWRTLTPKRWDILGVMVGAGPLAVREVARRVGRDVKAVHGDIRRLALNGIVKKTEEGKVEFPYDEIRMDFSMRPGPTVELGQQIRDYFKARQKQKAA